MTDKPVGIATYSKTLWCVALVVTLVVAVYQRLTGPTHPLRGSCSIGEQQVTFRLTRSATCGQPAEIKVTAPRPSTGQLRYKRHLSDDQWREVPMSRRDEVLFAVLPEQPPAGKVAYFVTLMHGGVERSLSDDLPIVLRFKGPVPAAVLIPHVLFMFVAMVVAARAGLEALDANGAPRRYALVTLFCLVLGGFVLGPIVQKYAFGAFWTGWPFGSDLTDNKAVVALVAWCYAAWASRDGRSGRGAILLAFIVMFAVYLIPHSMWGSEIDHRTGTAINAAPTAIPLPRAMSAP